MNEVKTHSRINQELCGVPVELNIDEAQVDFTASESMVSDESGLIHGGFIFGAADYSAMLAINTPNVVLGSSDVKFIKPTRVGEKLSFFAKVEKSDGKKKIVHVSSVNEKNEVVFTGSFICFDLDKHVLS